MKPKKPARQKEEDFHHNVYVVLLRDAAAKHLSILRLNPKRDGWEKAEPMPSARNYARAVVFRGAVYLVGGNPTVGMSHSSAGSRLVEKFEGCSRG